MEVFFCETGRRSQMAAECVIRWLAEPSALLVRMLCPSRSFQRSRRSTADGLAEGEFYVLADDDCLPQPEPFLDEAEHIMRAHADFAVLSLWPQNFKVNQWTEPGTVHDADVTEHASVGGIRFCRKGAMKAWPPMGETDGYDGIHCAALRANGWRSGYFRNLKMEHLGEGKSTVWA